MLPAAGRTLGRSAPRRALLPPRPAAPGPPRRAHRLSPADDERYERSRLTLLQRDEPGAALVESYSARGFRVGGARLLGPCALLPRALLQWNVGCYQDITQDSLVLFRLLEPRLEILVLGVGDKVQRLDPAVLKSMRECGIAVEVQDTPNACATFNFLRGEHRMAAAALIPPSWPHPAQGT
ncbi:NADH dehydrogenase [ubiquinone] 1 alpha subcomplex assembly factor 3 [Pelodiscus sinensis]|uniref:NADH dehydrogenase [ubiquinone] 1 alpha subcomplex assembly factor 3 n=1 Tax=Pelodiscus sinensis TaxID=13735 RepID=UPI003F6D7CA1